MREKVIVEIRAHSEGRLLDRALSRNRIRVNKSEMKVNWRKI